VRFVPDTWLDALLRPIAMAAADANAYVEIMAPDFRFVFVLGLLGLLAAMALLRRRGAAHGHHHTAPANTSARAVFLLLASLAAAFVPWLATSGNGRYFMVGLLMVGPVCVGLTRLLPVTRAMRMTLVIGMVILQAFAVQQSAPWRAWNMLSWTKPPYFQVDVPADARAQPATYVTMSAITYSLVAPMFHPQSRWMSLHNAPVPDGGGADARRTEAFLAKAQPGRLMLLVPAVAGMLTTERLPNARVSEAMDRQLAPYRLRLTQPQACRFLPSEGLAQIGLGTKTPEERSRSGFWLCHLTRSAGRAAPASPSSSRFDAVFKAVEAQCPRLFPAGGDARTQAVPNGEVRNYMKGEMKAYVYDSGEVYYKYYRALNPVLVGTVADLLAGRSRVDCDHIRGRSGLPWDREI
jgi:hypothetical protein